MSMSQEEIEALMSGLDIVDDDASSVDEVSPAEEENVAVNTDEIEELISQNEETNIVEDTKTEEKEIMVDDVESSTESLTKDIVDNDDIDALLKDLESPSVDETELEMGVESTEDIELEPIINNEITTESFDDISADEEGIVESTNKISEEENKEDSNSKEEIGKDWADSKINQGVFPLPADRDTKVVSQLSQVANDSEEKVSQIFDMLSLALDNNTEIRSKVQSFESYITSELELLNSLSSKFPNIEVFNTQKELSNQMSDNLKEISNIVDSEDMKIYEAMELMQFNDINRQKIERVMSVIRKLSLYLNNLFEDDGSTQDFAIAKHIHGDEDHDLIGDDLDKLINEFGK